MYSHEEIARRLREAYEGGPISPLRDALEPQDVAGAYAVQSINTGFWVAGGRRIVGRKIGLTAKAVQKQLGVEQPDYGVLFDDMVLESGSFLPAHSVLQPKVEAEIAIILEHDLPSASTTFFDVAAATKYVLPAIEIVDSRIADWKITIADTIADNASSAFCVLGNHPRAITDIDLQHCGMVLEINGVIASMGVGAACLGHPLAAAAWLARIAAERGDHLKRGDIVMTGALGPMSPLVERAYVQATIGGLGVVDFSFGAPA